MHFFGSFSLPSSPAATSTTTDSYDADGDLTGQTLPGGVQLTDSYDPNGNLLSQSGTGASAPTATRTFSYDSDGRMLTAATGAAGTAGTFGYQPATSESFSYDDRGLLLAAAGTAGASSFTYNASGQETSVTDPAGTSAYTYDSAGRLATDAELQHKIDDWLERTVSYVVDNYKGEVADLIATTVERWDSRDTSRRIELQVGHDLQFIRINGTVVGGIAGVLIYTVGQLLF